MKEASIKDEFDFSQAYYENCDACNKEFIVRTQPDNYPEYYTGVYIKCDCGDWVHFELPVN